LVKLFFLILCQAIYSGEVLHRLVHSKRWPVQSPLGGTKHVLSPSVGGPHHAGLLSWCSTATLRSVLLGTEIVFLDKLQESAVKGKPFHLTFAGYFKIPAAAMLGLLHDDASPLCKPLCLMEQSFPELTLPVPTAACRIDLVAHCTQPHCGYSKTEALHKVLWLCSQSRSVRISLQGLRTGHINLPTLAPRRHGDTLRT